MSVNIRIQLKRDTTANWKNATGFIPLAGEIIIYTDYRTENGINVPGIKIGDGSTFLQDLPFQSGITEADIIFWNNKINIDDSDEDSEGGLPDENLVITRGLVSYSSEI